MGYIWKINAVQGRVLMYKRMVLMILALLVMGNAQASIIDIRRTEDGIPHIKAMNWQDLGRGIAYVQAEDALCTLAQAFTTYAGQRSFYFGADQRPAFQSTLGRPTNRALDFFFKAFVGEQVIRSYKEQFPEPLQQLVLGYAKGYNQYLDEVQSSKVNALHRSCLKQEWLRKVTQEDVYRRLYAAQLAGGLAHFIPELVAASLPSQKHQKNKSYSSGKNNNFYFKRDLSKRLVTRLGADASLGSNALAFGSEVTGEQNAVLFGNPHWYWSGPDRFYQMHLIIPGKLNVAGASFLGVPLIMIGFNDHIAWTHTVSTARRFTLFQLALGSKNPRSYLVDGKQQQMRKRDIEILVKDENGLKSKEKRVFYSSLFGPVLDLSAWDSSLGWGAKHAMTLQDVNTNNDQLFTQFFKWNQAQSLDEFISIQQKELAMPWVNTVAIGRDDGRVWYADIGAIPNVPDNIKKACAAPLTKDFGHRDLYLPLLDGSRSDCQWLQEAKQDSNVLLGSQLPATQMPSLLRTDYVANMNNSYWLSNIYQPLRGYAVILGGEEQALSMRAQLGHKLALEQLGRKALSAQQLSERLQHDLLLPRAYSADLYKDTVIDLVCYMRIERENTQITSVEIKNVCDRLRSWNNQADAQEKAVVLWEHLWQQLSQQLIKKYGAEGFRVLFDPANPLNTPAEPKFDQAMVINALRVVLDELREEGIDINQPLAAQRTVPSGAERIAMFGGCDETGYFMILCIDKAADQEVNIHGNSYLQMVSFNQKGVNAYTLLAHGQDENAILEAPLGEAVNPLISAPIKRYAQRQWLSFPYTEQQINSDPKLQRRILWPTEE